MAIITGTNGNDSLVGTIGNDIISGLNGDDLINPNLGRDIVDGGDGIDTIVESGDVNFTLSNTILRGRGNDTLISIESAILTGGNGINVLNAFPFTLGSVNLDGGAGNDSLSGGSGDDTLLGGDGNDTLAGRDGDDFLDGGSDTDTIIGRGDVNFTLTDGTLVGLGTDTFINIETATLTGGAGNNTIDASAFSLGLVQLNGEGGNDILIGGSKNDRLNGGDENDVLTGGMGTDTLNGGDGIDTIVEFGDVNFTLSNTILRGRGTDTLISIESAILTGGVGNNTIDALAFTLGSVTLDGGAGNDTLRGGSSDDFLDGGDGIDTITNEGDVNFTLTDGTLVGASTDTFTDIETAILTGGVGNNTIDASAFTLGSVTLDGGAGDDTLLGGSGNDALEGGDGDDFIDGGSGTDTIISEADVNFTLTDGTLVGLGTDTFTDIETAILTGGVGNNTIDASAFTLGSVTLDGGSSSDTLLGGSGDDTLLGGFGNDTLEGKDGDDFIDGGTGRGIDTIIGRGDVNFTLTNRTLVGLGTDTFTNIETAILTGGAGNNTIDASASFGVVQLNGEAGNDVLIGGSNTDRLNGGDGNDFLTGGMGFDSLIGGDGNDVLTGGMGFDSLVGGDGNDSLVGGDGNDSFNDTSGSDSINGGDGFDTLSTFGAGDLILTNTSLTGFGFVDTLTSIEFVNLESTDLGDNIIDTSAFTLGDVDISSRSRNGNNSRTGNDTLIAGNGNDRLLGGNGNDTLNGGDGNDSLSAGDGNNILNGGDGNDDLFGRDGNDTLNGGNGNDDLFGGLGNNILNGGNGNDMLFASDGNDTLIGTDSNNGLGEIDRLRGSLGITKYILGSNTSVFYDDGNNATSGINDYALIDGLSRRYTIQLKGSANLYVMGASPRSALDSGIFLDTNSNGAFNSTDELIAVIVNGSFAPLSLTSSNFIYV